jgi:hypothetical protein
VSRARWTAGLAAAWLVAAAAPAAHACAVCGPARSEVAMAFLWMTLLLTALPLAMVGGCVFWLWSRARAEERRASEPLEPDPAAPVQSWPFGPGAAAAPVQGDPAR